jgi:hypothetical protein
VDNTSNNNMATQNIKDIFHRHHIYIFSTEQQRLPCLAHVINLTIIAVMSTIMKIAVTKLSTAIWEYDPTDLENCVATICTLAVKIQTSGQCISYFEHLQHKCSIDKPLTIPLYSKIQWGTVEAILEQSYWLHHVNSQCHCIVLVTNYLCQPINLFVLSADELFGPITSMWCAREPVQHIQWSAFALKPSDWQYVDDTCNIISDVNTIQHIFSQNHLATLWQVIPAFEELQTAWETKQKLPKFVPYKDAIQNGLDKIHQYYNKFDEKPVYMLALAELCSLCMCYD